MSWFTAALISLAGDDRVGSGNVLKNFVESPRITGIKNDLAEIRGRFRSGIAKLSQTMSVSEISKAASSFLQLDKAEEEGVMKKEEGFEVNAVGVNEDVLMFVHSIAMYRATWLDFPLINDLDDFEMSNDQNEHALAVEHLVPTLANLRNELCPRHMSEGCFWMIYFVLLHPKLSEHDAEMLSTPLVLEARAMLLQDLQSQTRTSVDTPEPEASKLSHEALDHPVRENRETPSSFLSEQPLSKLVALARSNSDPIAEKHPVQPLDSEDTGDGWLEDDASDSLWMSNTVIPIGQEEDASFIGLEDDDETTRNSTSGAAHVTESELDDSKDWVQLNKATDVPNKNDSPTGLQRNNSNDWLNIEDIDVE